MIKSAIMSKLSDAIKSAREDAGFKQAEVADLLGETQSNYNAMENGRRPISKKTIKKLAELPGFPLTETDMLWLKGLETSGLELDKKSTLAIVQEAAQELTNQEIVEILLSKFESMDELLKCAQELFPDRYARLDEEVNKRVIKKLKGE